MTGVWSISNEELKETALMFYKVEGLNVVFDDVGGRKRIDYTAKDEADLEKWLIEEGRLMCDKWNGNFAEGVY